MPDRIIRDELLTSERYWSVSAEARNLFISLVLSADDTGRYTAAPFALRTKCMAGTVSHERIEKLVLELVDIDLVRVYDEGRHLFIPRFRQRLRYNTSRYPEPPKEINDITDKKTDSRQSQVSLKTAEVKRSEEKRREEVLGLSISPTRGEEVKVKTVLKNIPEEQNQEQLERNRRIALALASGDLDLAKEIREGRA